MNGTKLLPLIELARIEQQRHPIVRALNISSNANKAHAPALAAMRRARDGGRETLLFTQLDARACEATNEVARLTRRLDEVGRP